MIRKNIALCCAGIMLALTAAMPFGASAEETAGGTSVVQVEKSQILVKKSIPASQITGQIAVTVHDHPVQVTIINKTREGNETYYDMEIAPVQDSHNLRFSGEPVGVQKVGGSRGKSAAGIPAGFFAKYVQFGIYGFPERLG